MDHYGDHDANYSLCTWNDHQTPDEGTGRTGNRRISVAIQTTVLLRSTRILRRVLETGKKLDVAQTSLKDDQLLLLCWLVVFYGISIFVGYLMPNPFLYKATVLFQQFSLAEVHSLIVESISSQAIQLMQTVLI